MQYEDAQFIVIGVESVSASNPPPAVQYTAGSAPDIARMMLRCAREPNQRVSCLHKMHNLYN